jgi:hypothetical protein
MNRNVHALHLPIRRYRRQRRGAQERPRGYFINPSTDLQRRHRFHQLLSVVGGKFLGLAASDQQSPLLDEIDDLCEAFSSLEISHYKRSFASHLLRVSRHHIKGSPNIRRQIDLVDNE